MNGATWGHPRSAYNGSYNAYLGVVVDTKMITRLVSPRIDFGTTAHAGRLTFWHCMENWLEGQDELRVYYKTTVAGSWIALTNYTTAVIGWTQQTIDLPNPTRTYYVAFEGTAKYGHGVCLDDVYVGDPTPALSITNASALQSAVTGTSYSLAFGAVGGTAPYTFSLLSGSLPTGFSLSSDGVLSGQSDVAQASSFTVQVKDANDETASNTYTFNVVLPRADIFTEDFENNGALPTGWTQEYVAAGVSWSFQLGGHNSQPPTAASGAYNALLWSGAWVNGAAPDQRTKLVSPPINLGQAPASTKLTFWQCMKNWEDGQDELRVYYRTSETASWVLLATYTDAVSVWTERTVTLPNPTSTYYIAFEGSAKFGYGVCIDNIRISDEAEAPIITTDQALPNGITGLAYSNPLTAVGGELPYTWTVVSNSLPDGLTMSSEGVISGMPVSAALAFFRVRVAGSDGKATTNLFSLRITIPGPMPFNETFENGGAIPSGWTQVSLLGSESWTFRTGSQLSPDPIPASAHGGQYNASFFSTAADGRIARLISPMLNLGVGTLNTRLTFWYCMARYYSGQDSLKVLYRTSANGDWVQLAEYTGNIVGWTQCSINLPNPSTSYYIAFEGWSFGGYGVCIDDVNVTGDFSAYLTWKNSMFTTNEVKEGIVVLDSADPDGDGIVNGLEYAYGLDPKVFNATGFPVGSVTNGFLTLTYRKNKAATDAVFTVQSCTSLVTQVWSTNEIFQTAADIDTNTWLMTALHTVPVTNAPSRFMQLKVTLP